MSTGRCFRYPSARAYIGVSTIATVWQGSSSEDLEGANFTRPTLTTGARVTPSVWVAASALS